MSNNLKYTLTEVVDKKSSKLFLECPVRVLKSEKNWIRPLDEDIEKIFDPKHNKLFRKGNAKRWILRDSGNKTIGRIAAFYTESINSKNDQPTGGCGFFDCINDQEAASILFDAAKTWLQANGMEAMDGPINFGSRESFWGCLAEGFYKPNYNMPYNPPYYNDLFINYGFQNYFNQYTYHMPIDPDIMDPAIKNNAERLKEDRGFVFKNIESGKLEKYADDFLLIFNETWASFPGVRPMKKEQALALFKKLKPVHDKRAIIFGYYNKRPVGFFIMIPDLYQSYQKFNGKFHLINKLRLLYDLKIRKSYTKLIGLIFGVVPEFQKKGVSGGLIMHFAKDVVKPNFHFTDLEMNWIGDFNPGMIKLVEQLGAEVRKVHITYRYLFDRDRKFKRASSVN